MASIQSTEVQRVFQYDYIYFDAILLCVWVGTLLGGKKYKALLFGAVIAPIIYFIDAQFWFSQGIREYTLGGAPLTYPEALWSVRRFGIDFMMDISYSLFAFPWIWIMFEALKRRARSEIKKYTLLYLGLWMVTPLASILLTVDDTVVETIRHMSSQVSLWVINVVVGYSLLAWVYRTQISMVLKVFAVGVAGGLIMEIPLYVYGIRSQNYSFLVYEGIFLLNQGVPYLFIFYDKFLPLVGRQLLALRSKF